MFAPVLAAGVPDLVQFHQQRSGSCSHPWVAADTVVGSQADDVAITGEAKGVTYGSLFVNSEMLSVVTANEEKSHRNGCWV